MEAGDVAPDSNRVATVALKRHCTPGREALKRLGIRQAYSETRRPRWRYRTRENRTSRPFAFRGRSELPATRGVLRISVSRLGRAALRVRPLSAWQHGGLFLRSAAHVGASVASS